MLNKTFWRFFIWLGALAMTAVSAAPVQAQLSEAQVAHFSQNADQHVIVIMKSRHPAVHKDSAELAERSAAIDAEQAPLMEELRQVHAANIKNYHLVNALAAIVSKAELERLKSNPAVAAVVPDVVVRNPRRKTATASKSSADTAEAGATTSSLTPNVIPGACGANGRVLLDPEGLALTHTDSDNRNEPTARSLGITGAGVKVAWIADGLDPNNINFIRPDGKSVFDPSIGGDYQDFSGDGPGEPTDGGEAFGDANTIAGQGIHVYNVNGFSAQPDPSACNIRIEGVAPGASLVGLEALGSVSTLSSILEAIDYAVETDHVDVINQSLGTNNFPDITSLDAWEQFDDAAVAAGVVVSISSGDAGSTNTIGSPSTDPLVFSVGATTDFRFYAQTNYAAARYFATTGWLNNNIDPFSSGGFEENGRTIDLVGPGDASFASCDANATLFAGCVNLLGEPSIIESFGGTSESSPFVAGASALVIQAYRQTHGGASPTPALVKQILLSTAADLGAPGNEQGAGLLNSYQAVLLAESIPTSDGSPRPVGNTLLLSSNQLNAVGEPGTSENWSVTVTNTGEFPQFVYVNGRTIGPDQNVQSGSVTLNDTSSPHFVDFAGVLNNYAVINFQVPGGADRLEAAIAWPGNPIYCLQEFCDVGLNSRVRLILIDPQGRFAAHSRPQGPGNFDNLDVRFPTPGTWTGVIFGDVASAGGTNGTVIWQVETEQFVPFGSVTPNFLVLPPGQSRSFSFSATTPRSAGDTAGSIVLTSDFGFGGTTSIPVTLRSLVDVAHGGRFRGVLTGGNGRPGGEGQEQFYQFDVPKGVSNITANVSLTNDANDPVATYLISPDGDTLGYGQNSLNGTNSLSVTAYTLNPVPGTWTLIVDFAEPVVGNEISQPYTGNIQFNKASASATGLPNNPAIKLAAGTPVTVPVTITNTGAAPEDFFIDARLDGTTGLALAPQLGSSDTIALPITTSPAFWIVPTETSSLSLSQTSTVPANFNFQSTAGDPLLASASFGTGPLCSDTASASYSPPGGTVTAGGYWDAEPTECGPFAGPAPTGSATISMTANAKPFDPAVSSVTGDLWLVSVDPATFATFSPLVLNPGQTGTINVTITPSGASGTVVRGALYVDDFVSSLPLTEVFAGDELVAIPYAYTIQ